MDYLIGTGARLQRWMLDECWSEGVSGIGCFKLVGFQGFKMDRVRKIRCWVWDCTWLGLFNADLFLFYILLMREYRDLKGVNRCEGLDCGHTV